MPSDHHEPGVIGWFMLAWRGEPTREHAFTAHNDGRVIPEQPFPQCTTWFTRCLADPNLSSVRFVQCDPRREGGRPIVAPSWLQERAR